MKRPLEEHGKLPTKPVSRRSALKALGLGGAVGAAAVSGGSAIARAATDGDRPTLGDALAGYFQDHYRRMDREEIQAAIGRLERKYKAKYDVEIKVSDTPPLPNTLYGYALNISKCKGYRECVSACVEENNQSRDSEIQYIKVLEMHQGAMDLESSDPYYDPELVPEAGKYYLPVQCHHCEDSPCERACPTGATWKERDGIVVVDYDWCIGCRYCMATCPYEARRFNWTDPQIPKEEINPVTHYLSNRPRPRGVVEKCTFCLQRVRKGLQPACQEACPTGARVFGNLLDPKSELRYILENKTVFRLKEDLKTEPKFWYYTD